MSVNFFSWIREGVKHSVLLGVSDAIETIGTPEDPKNLHPSMAALLQNSPSRESSSAPASLVPPQRGAGSRKRLGRSLKDIDIKPAG